jgi:Aldehyde dehydrogenase family
MPEFAAKKPRLLQMPTVIIQDARVCESYNLKGKFCCRCSKDELSTLRLIERKRLFWRLIPGPIVPFIAETGGQNAMIVDSSALAEQVVADVLASAFDSAGQRCSTRSLRPAMASPSASTAASTRPCATSSRACGSATAMSTAALSGNGPKASGPPYLHRFATARTVSTDTTAAGGNATLLSLQEETETVASLASLVLAW